MFQLIIYGLVLLALKLYTSLPNILKTNNNDEQNKLESEKRTQTVVQNLMYITGFFTLLVVLSILGGVFSILVGDSFYDVFKHKASIAEAYDEGETGSFDTNIYGTFKFGLRMIILNLIIIKPLFGIGLLEYYSKDKN